MNDHAMPHSLAGEPPTEFSPEHPESYRAPGMTAENPQLTGQYHVHVSN